MKYPWRFQFSVWLIALLSAVTLVVAEYMYDSTAAAVSFLNTVVLLVFATTGFLCQGKKMPLPLAILIKTVMVVSAIGFVWVLLFGSNQSSFGRAFRLSHIALILMACRFLLIRRTQDYTQIILLSMLLMIVAAITSGNIVIAPFYVIYLLLIVYCLMIYQFQRQVEMVRATRFVGYQPSENEIRSSSAEIKSYWRQLGQTRFKITCTAIILMALCFSLVVFLLFPRLEAGALLGSSFGSRSTSDFSDRIELGNIDKNETLKQVVARVAVRSDGQSIASSDRPVYLRCMALDNYTVSDSSNGRYFWSRSFLNYFLDQPLLRGPITPGSAILEQDVLLNPINSAYLPGLYPIVQVDGLDNERLVSSALDSTVTRYYYRSQNPIDYRMASLARLNQKEALDRFKQNLLNLGQQWFALGYNRFAISRETIKLAQTIAGELTEQRLALSQKQERLFNQWWQHLSQNTKSKSSNSFKIQSWLFLRRLKEPDEKDRKYHKLTSDLFELSSELALVDRQISHKIVDYLRSHYTYTIEPPDFSHLETDDDEEDSYFDPISGFLEHQSEGGHCEYFASAMVQLCRSLGIPARLAVGFLAHEYLPERDYYLVRQRNAHSWVEIYTADRGWSLFDPTPLAATASVQQGFLSNLFQQFTDVFEKFQFNWLKYSASPHGQDSLRWANAVTDWVEQLEFSDQFSPEESSFFQDWFTHHPDESYLYLFLRWMIFFLCLIDLGIVINVLVTWGIPRVILWRKHKRQISAYSESSIGFYREMLYLLQEIHLYKPTHQTSREFALAVMAYSKDFDPVGHISEVYYRLRFGNESLDQEHQALVDKALERLKVFVLSLKKTTERPWPWETQD